MKEDVKNKWVEALRSRKYKQGQGLLKCQNTFCCLGVLCDISGLGEWNIPDSANPDDYCNVTMGYVPTDDPCCTQSQVLPHTVARWAGIKSENGDYRVDDVWYSLTELNDDRGMTFSEIADIIEELWPEL
jgi:hypothetical protein